MLKALITGSTGHLGSRALELLQVQYEVHAVVRTRPSAAHADVTYHETDLSQEWTTNALPARMDIVVHLAQPRNYRNFPEHSLDTFRINTGATAMLLDYARRAGVTHFILASTGGLYQPGTSVIDDKTPISPPRGDLSYYFRTKQSAELLADAYKPFFDVSVLRPFFIYGPGQSQEKLISRLIESVRERRTISLSGQNGMRINPVHVDDVADLICNLSKAGGSRTLNVAGPDVVSIRGIAEEVGLLSNMQPVFECVEGPEEMIVADISAFASFLDRSPTRFADGLKTLFP